MAQLFKPPVNYRNNDALPAHGHEGCLDDEQGYVEQTADDAEG